MSENAPGISGVTLETLTKQFLSVMATIERLSKRYHADVLEKMIYMETLSAETMEDRNKTEIWFKELETRLNEGGNSSSVRYKITVSAMSEL